MKRIIMILVLFSLVACSKESILSVNYDSVFNSENMTRTVSFLVTDDKSEIMNWTIYIDGLEKAYGQCYNNTRFDFDIEFEETNLNDRNVTLEIIDNTGKKTIGYQVVGFDTENPVIHYIKIY